MSLKHVILTLLHREPSTGYDLVRTFDSAAGYFWHASHQQVYRELGSLAENKLVRVKQVNQEDKPNKKVYSLTTNGTKTLQNWLENPIKEHKTKDLLLVKLLNVNGDNVHLMQHEIDRHVGACTELQKTYLEIEKVRYSPQQRHLLPNNQLMIYAALRKGILEIEANLTWLDEVKKIIKDS